MTGVLISFEAVIKISWSRGIPRVTFISLRPALWKVFRLKNEIKKHIQLSSKHIQFHFAAHTKRLMKSMCSSRCAEYTKSIIVTFINYHMSYTDIIIFPYIVLNVYIQGLRNPHPKGQTKRRCIDIRPKADTAINHHQQFKEKCGSKQPP